MDKYLRECLEDRKNDYLLPFLWVHGEPQGVLLREIHAIKESGINSFCVESRPYEHLCEPEWWEDFGFILKTARELEMHVWLLDDKHFPSGYANGAIEKKYPQLRKKMLRCEKVDVLGPQQEVSLLCSSYTRKGDRLLGAVAYRRTGEGLVCSGAPINLMPSYEDDLVHFDVPEGMWRVFFLLETQRPTPVKPDHIDMLNPDSTELMISEIYQPHYDHFSEYFGNTFCGFFSDEPGFLNHAGTYFGHLGKNMPLPWNGDLPALLAEKLQCGEEKVYTWLPALWSDVGADTARVRVAYMDVVTSLYAHNFTEKLGGWCRSHGVQYIGHIIEDMGSCSRLGHSAGHYFRSLDAQDMAGIDVVLHQIMPGQNDMPHTARIYDQIADPSFFVYALAKLGASHSHINPAMQNRAMCEIYGAYGYAEGLPFMKKLTDHMLANGINRFVPHAFSPKYPDPDCPPHFYSGGKNPQFPLFGELMRYTQRVIHLLEGSVHQANVLLYYNAECEWSGQPAETYFRVAKLLTQGQIDFDFVSEDYLCRTEARNRKLFLNQEQYDVLVLPGCRYLTDRMKEILHRLIGEGIPVLFCGEAPDEEFRSVLPENIVAVLRDLGAYDITLSVPSPHLRYYHTVRDGRDYYLFKNDGEEPVDTTVLLKQEGEVAVYDAWSNQLSRFSGRRLVLAGGECVIWICGEETADLPAYCPYYDWMAESPELHWNMDIQDVDMKEPQRYRTDSSLFNLNGKGELTRFSGRILYTTEWETEELSPCLLDLGYVGETAKVVLNGVDCGTRIAAPYLFDIGRAMKKGTNHLEIEVINNPAYRERDPFSAMMRMMPGGILGPVRFLKEEQK